MDPRMQPVQIVPVGVVRSLVKVPDEMPLAGVPASIEVFPEYVAALDGIEEYSHLFILCHMDGAGRDVIKARPRKLGEGLPERGVFAMRSPARPNPIGLCVSKLVRRNDSILHVEPLDAVDGTPVVDIKPYAYGWDCIFSARSARPMIDPRFASAELLADALRMARNFHGEACPGIVIGVRATLAALRELGIDDPRGTKRLVVFAESDRCVTDAVMALTGCTPGKRTLKVTDAGKLAATFLDTATGRAVRVVPRDAPAGGGGEAHAAEDREATSRRLLAMDEKELLVLSEVRLQLRDEDRPGPPSFSVRCEACGETVHDRRDVKTGGRTLCRHCAGQGYYTVL